MRYERYLRIARALSLTGNLPDKQHLVVCLAFIGKSLRAARLNSATEHAEMRALRAVPEAERLVVYRFNRADPARADRPSCPCWGCVPVIRASGVTKVEFMSPLGPVVVKCGSLQPYREKSESVPS